MIALFLLACMPETPTTTQEDTGTPSAVDSGSVSDTGTTADTGDTGTEDTGSVTTETGDTSTTPTDTEPDDTGTQDTATGDTGPTDTGPEPFECSSSWGNVSFTDGRTSASTSTSSAPYLTSQPIQGAVDLCRTTTDRPWLSCWLSSQSDCDPSAQIELPAEDGLKDGTVTLCLSVDWDPGKDEGVCSVHTSQQTLTWTLKAS